MNRLSILLIVTLSVLSLSAFDIEQGKKKKYFDNGNLKRVFLKEPVVVDSIELYRWCHFYENGKVKSYDIAADTKIYNILMPAYTRIFRDENGVVTGCFLSEDLMINGYPCNGGKAKSGTYFHPNGNLRTIFLYEPCVINGIECDPGGLSPVRFYDDGKLKSLVVGKNTVYRNKEYKKYTEMKFDKDGNVIASGRPGFFARLWMRHIAYGTVKLIFGEKY